MSYLNLTSRYSPIRCRIGPFDSDEDALAWAETFPVPDPAPRLVGERPDLGDLESVGALPVVDFVATLVREPRQ